MAQKDLTKMGQDGLAGDPDPAAVAAVEEANAIPDGASLVGDIDTEAAEAPEEPGLTADRETLISALRSSPGLVDELRQILGVGPGQGGVPQNVRGWRDFDANELKVFGGTEVRHPEWENGQGEPLPPGYIKRYQMSDGRGGVALDEEGHTKLTDYAEPHTERRRRPVPMVDQESGKQMFNRDGNPIYDEQIVEVVINIGAAKDVEARPIKSEGYEQWLRARVTGARLGSEVRSQLGQQRAADGSPVVRFDDAGAPAVVGDGIEAVPAGV
jgi:hypothetical protein